MPFGIKIKTVKTKNAYTIKELYETIQDQEFTAGIPSIIFHGSQQIIVFPPLDCHNQVWILNGSFNEKSHKFFVQKCPQAGIDNMITSTVLNTVTAGTFDLGRTVGNNAKQCKLLVDETAKELGALNL